MGHTTSQLGGPGQPRAAEGLPYSRRQLWLPLEKSPSGWQRKKEDQEGGRTKAETRVGRGVRVREPQVGLWEGSLE